MQENKSIQGTRKNRRLAEWLFFTIYLHLLALLWIGLRFSWTGFSSDFSRFTPIDSSNAAGPSFSAGILAMQDLLATYVLSLGVLPAMISGYGILTAKLFKLALDAERREASERAKQKRNHLSFNGWQILLAVSTALTITWPIQYGLWVTHSTEASSTVFYCAQFLNYYLWGFLIICSWIEHRNLSVLLGISITAISALRFGTIFWIIDHGQAFFLSMLVLTYHHSKRLRLKLNRAEHSKRQTTKSNNGSAEDSMAAENPTSPNPIETFSLFVLGGFIAYDLACLVSLFAAAGNRNSDNWGVYMPLFLGLWLIPIVGTLTTVIHQLTGPWAWSQRHQPRKLAGYAILICILIWTAILTM